MKTQKRFFVALTCLTLIGLLIIGWFQRYSVYDWLRLRGYSPPTRVVQLADETTMTAYGRKLFYVNHPQLNDKNSFNQNCTISEQSIVLGCYITSQGIFLFDVSDDRLSGVHQVTAAHEMLHAAYERLSSSERHRVDNLNNQVLAQLTDDRIIETVKAYRDRDPKLVPNELHSIFATEVERLPAELESYYRRYFTDRQKVVQFSKQYEAAFSERKKQVQTYDDRLKNLKQQIDTLETGLVNQEKNLASERAELDQLLAAKQYEQYNSKVPGFNTRVRAYNADVAKIRQLIEEYNAIVAARNAIASEENELVEAIDSRPDTIPTE